MRNIPVGKSFLFRSKGWPAATVFNPVICGRWCQGWESSSAPQEHLLTDNAGKLTMYWEAAAKHAANRHQGKAHQVRGDKVGKKLMKHGSSGQ